MFLKTYIFVVSLVVAYIIGSPPLSFGKFEVVLNNFEFCKGPKRKDCTKWEIAIEGNKILNYNLTVLQNVAPLKVKVIVSSNGKELVRLQMSKVCENAFMKPLFKSLFNVTNKCVIPKGYYHHVMDIEEVVQQYYGGEFLYGNVTFKSVFNNDECNFSCSTLQVVLTPKKSD